jgi:hypothetical protein
LIPALSLKTFAPATATILVSTAPATAGIASVSTLLTIISKMPGCTAAMVSSTHAGAVLRGEQAREHHQALGELGRLARLKPRKEHAPHRGQVRFPSRER